MITGVESRDIHQSLVGPFQPGFGAERHRARVKVSFFLWSDQKVPLGWRAGGGVGVRSGGKCLMGIKTRGQMEGTAWRPEWPRVSRSGCDRAVGQGGLRPEGQESNPH